MIAPTRAAASPVGWDADPAVATTLARPTLREDVTADACVIGLGGSGLAAVQELLARGLSVVGLDAGRVGAGAAGRNGGFLLGGPSAAVHQAAQEWGVETAVELYRETLAEIDLLEAVLGSEVIRRVGSIRLAGLPRTRSDDVDDAAERADCAQQYAFLREHGIGVETYDGPLGHGLFLPDDAAMNPARRVLGLAGAYGLGARLYEHSPVTSLDTGRVQTQSGSVAAGVIIVAVDGGLEVILPELASRVRTGRLQMLSTAPLAIGTLPCPVYSRWGYDYAQQDPSGRLFVGGGRDRFVDQEWTLAATPTADVQQWIDELATSYAGGPVQVTHRWAASVGYTVDGRPLVVQERPGVVACGGYSGTGNLVGPIAARASVALAVDGVVPRPYFQN